MARAVSLKRYTISKMEYDMKLFEHHPHPHVPTNVNEQHADEQQASGLNQRLAVLLTRLVGSMWCAYLFTGIAVLGLLGLLGLLNPFVFLLMQWVSQQFLQLVLLSVIMVGQAVLGRKQELQAEEQFNTTKKTFEDILQIMKHLEVQDEELLNQTNMLLEVIQDIRRRRR
jgi:hypothetical protein